MPDHPKIGHLDQLLDNLFRTEYGNIVAYLSSIFGTSHLMFIEDIAQETLLEAYKNWSYHGLPPEPKRWIFLVARNKAINFSVREQKRNGIYLKYQQALEGNDIRDVYLKKEIKDSVLRMIFACATLDISALNKIILILNTLGGFNRKEIAKALLMEEETVKKRLFRAKKEIRDRNLELLVPTGKDLLVGLDSVLACLYLLFNEGYNSTLNDDLIRQDICLEAIRLATLVGDHFSEETAPKALLALMYFHAGRFKSRIDDSGAIILLQDQDRTNWDLDLIRMGKYHLSEASKGLVVTPYHLEAAIADEHCRAADLASTNWPRIYSLYEALLKFKPSPIIDLNLAIVTSMLGDHDLALEKLQRLESNRQMQKYYLLYATKGELHRILGQHELALKNFAKASDLTESHPELQLLAEKISNLR